MHRYRGRFCDVNVVNEALEWGVDTFDTQPLKAGPDYAGGFYYRHFGPYYIDSVFKWAHAADPNAKLYYNDDLIENINNRSNVLYKLVKQWLGRGVFINGIGFETHLSPDQNDSIWDTINYQSFKQNIARFTALGLDVQITELDVRLNLANVRMNSDTEYAKQGHIYAELARIFLSEPRCRGFVMWGI